MGSVVDAAGLDASEIAERVKPFEQGGIVAFSEGRIAPTARLAQLLDLPYYSVQDISAITNKDLRRERLRDRGVESGRFREMARVAHVGDALDRVGLPAIIKPTTGAASRHTLPVTTESQCAAAVAAILADEPASSPSVPATVIVEDLFVGRPVGAPWGDHLAVDRLAAGDDVRPSASPASLRWHSPTVRAAGTGSHPP